MPGINYVPSPRHTQPGQPPQVGQATVYIEEDGSRYPAMIKSVEAHNDAGTLYQVAVVWIDTNVEGDAALSNPGALTLRGRLYNVERGACFYCPCSPPFPDHCP